MADSRLSPFPDDVVLARDPERAITFLKALGLPQRYALQNLIRWGEYTGVDLTRSQLRAVAPSLVRREE